MIDYKRDIEQINEDFVNLFWGEYMREVWSITVGYNVVPMYLAVTHKKLADWQLAQDCTGLVCARSRQPDYTILAYPVYGVDPLAIRGPQFCGTPIQAISSVVPEQVVINTTPPFTIVYYTVGISGGPIAGDNSFVPLDIDGNPYLIGREVDVELMDYGPLIPGRDYTFNTILGVITLIGRIFNDGAYPEVYKITSF